MSPILGERRSPNQSLEAKTADLQAELKKQQQILDEALEKQSQLRDSVIDDKSNTEKSHKKNINLQQQIDNARDRIKEINALLSETEDDDPFITPEATQSPDQNTENDLDIKQVDFMDALREARELNNAYEQEKAMLSQLSSEMRNYIDQSESSGTPVDPVEFQNKAYEMMRKVREQQEKVKATQGQVEQKLAEKNSLKQELENEGVNVRELINLVKGVDVRNRQGEVTPNAPEKKERKARPWTRLWRTIKNINLGFGRNKSDDNENWVTPETTTSTEPLFDITLYESDSKLPVLEKSALEKIASAEQGLRIMKKYLYLIGAYAVANQADSPFRDSPALETAKMVYDLNKDDEALKKLKIEDEAELISAKSAFDQVFETDQKVVDLINELVPQPAGSEDYKLPDQKNEGAGRFAGYFAEENDDQPPSSPEPDQPADTEPKADEPETTAQTESNDSLPPLTEARLKELMESGDGADEIKKYLFAIGKYLKDHPAFISQTSEIREIAATTYDDLKEDPAFTDLENEKYGRQMLYDSSKALENIDQVDLVIKLME